MRRCKLLLCSEHGLLHRGADRTQCTAEPLSPWCWPGEGAVGGSEGESLVLWAADGKPLTLLSRDPQGVRSQSLIVSPCTD